jgi:predicted metalloenzyme YecM
MSTVVWEKLKNDFPLFIEKIFRFTEDLDLDVGFLDIDHAGLRFRNSEDVDSLKKVLEQEGNTIISDQHVNGRTIFIFKLVEPLSVGQYEIPCIELPYPATNHPYSEDGWEHVEFVLPSTAKDTESFEKEFRDFFPEFSPETIKYGYRLEMPQVLDPNEPPNPSIAIQKVVGLSIKFHPKPIDQIVGYKNLDQ